MEKLTVSEIIYFIESATDAIYQEHIANFNHLNLETILRAKNPYLFRFNNLLLVEQMVRHLVDEYIFSNQEAAFDNLLRNLAIFINQKVYNGRKSGITGVDLEFDKENVRYIVAIKSGPNWGNSSQIKKMCSDFKSAIRTLRTSNSGLQIVSVNGCCYGKDNQPDKGDYFKYCGARFWEFISGEPELYTKIIEPLGHGAKIRNEQFLQSYAQMLNKFTREFANEFCTESGAIDWNRLVMFNSGKQ